MSVSGSRPISLALKRRLALGGVDDDARAGGLCLALDRPLPQVEEASEERILQQRVVFPHPALDRDSDNAGRDPPDDRRQGLHRCAAGLGDRGAGEGCSRAARCQSDPARHNERRKDPVHRLETLTLAETHLGKQTASRNVSGSVLI